MICLRQMRVFRTECTEDAEVILPSANEGFSHRVHRGHGGFLLESVFIRFYPEYPRPVFFVSWMLFSYQPWHSQFPLFLCGRICLAPSR